MGWLDRLRRGGGATEKKRPAREDRQAPAARQVAVIGLDGVGLPLVQDLIARGLTPNAGAARGGRHDGPDAVVHPDDLERLLDRLHDREEPGQARRLRLHRSEARAP